MSKNLTLADMVLRGLMYGYIMDRPEDIYDVVGDEQVPEDIVEGAINGDDEVAIEIAGNGEDVSCCYDVVNKKYFVDEEYVDDKKLEQLIENLSK